MNTQTVSMWGEIQHWDKKNPSLKYRLLRSELAGTEKGKDLGVIVDKM